MTSRNKVNIFLAEFSKLSDLEIQKQYLNCWEWTESITVALSQLEDELQILRIIRLALEVDLVLGVKLISGIAEDVREKAIAFIIDLSLPETLLINLLITTKSKHTVPCLEKILDRLIFHGSRDFYRTYKISTIICFIKDIEPEFILRYFIKILESDRTTLSDLDLEYFNDGHYESLGFILDRSKIANKQLCDRIKKLLRQKLISSDREKRDNSSLAMKCLAILEDDWAITELKNDYFREDYFYLSKREIITTFSYVEDSSVVPYFICDLFRSDRGYDSSAIGVLKRRKDITEDLKLDVLIYGLCQVIDNEESRYITNMSIGEALNKISPERAIAKLSLTLECNDFNIRINALEALRYIHHQSILDVSIKALQDNSEKVVIEALRNFFAYPQLNNSWTNIVLSIDSLDNCLYSNNSKVCEFALELIQPSISDFGLTLQVKKSQPIHNLQIGRASCRERVLDGV